MLQPVTSNAQNLKPARNQYPRLEMSSLLSQDYLFLFILFDKVKTHLKSTRPVNMT